MSNIDNATGVFRLDENGHEILDPNPVEVPLGMKRPESLAEQVQRLVRTSISNHAAMHGLETFEESEDFDVGDDFDPSTPYEEQFDPVLGVNLTPADFQDPERREWLKNRYLQAERNAIRAQAERDAIDDAYKAARKSAVIAKHNRGAGVSPAPSSSEPKAPPAEPQADA